MESKLQDVVAALTAAGKFDGDASGLRCTTLKGDGSDRVFVRVGQGQNSFVVIFPSATHPKAKAEARSCFTIGRHLFGQGVAVPEIYGFDERSGAVVCEDLGDCSLYALAHDPKCANREELYVQAVQSLAQLQIAGCKGFDGSWCWDSPHYDRQVMLERESGYFADEFCGSYLGESVPPPVEAEFLRLAERVGKEANHFLLHRDFQSRNLMIKDGVVRIIDFQGARFGPLGYDLASLLHDPYVQLSAQEKSRLLTVYLAAVAAHISLDQASFLKGYYHIALQRNMQVLGAYAFLSQKRGKLFFVHSISPALETLSELLTETLQDTYPQLNAFVLKLREKFHSRQE